MSNFAKQKAASSGGVLQQLQNFQIGGGGAHKVKIKKRDMIFILRNISILQENGLSLPRALDTLVREPALKRYAPMLQEVKQSVESGDAFSTALARFPEAFPELMITQVRVGEKSGTIPVTLGRIMNQLEHADNLKGTIIKKLTYPVLLVVAGSGAVTFMLLYVVPTFQTVYEESGAKLPGVTQFLIDFGQFATSYGWMVALGVLAFTGVVVAIRRNTAGRLWMDTKLLKVPGFGTLFKNIAVLQFMEMLGNLMDAGFTVVEALRTCTNSVGNRAVRKSIGEMHEALLRGEKFSDELDRHRDLIPPVVNQLVVIGEQTGTLNKTTVHIRAHLRREVEDYTNLMVGTIEPVATISMAIVIGTMVLAIYLPMFDMISAMG